MRMYPHNPMYYIATVFLPWRFGKTFIEIEKDMLTINRYFAKGGKLQLTSSTIPTESIKGIGFPHDFHLSGIEEKLKGKNGMYYIPQEILFVTDEKNVSWNVRPYTKKQVRMLIEELHNKLPVQVGTGLAKSIKLPCNGDVKKFKRNKMAAK